MKRISLRYGQPVVDLTNEEKNSIKNFYNSILAVRRFLDEKKKQLIPKDEITGHTETFTKFFTLISDTLDNLENSIKTIVKPKIEEMLGEEVKEPTEDLLQAIEELPTGKKETKEVEEEK